MSKIIRNICVFLCVLLILGGTGIFGFRLFFIFKDFSNRSKLKDIRDDFIPDNDIVYTSEFDTDGIDNDTSNDDPEEEVSISDENIQEDSTDDSVKKVEVLDLVASDFSDEAKRLCGEFINALRKEYNNEEIVGYLMLDGYDIEYPIVQGETNDDYLKSNARKEYDYNGSIFLDSSNHRNFEDSRNLVYGHNMRNGSMFGSLRKFYESGVAGKTFTIYSDEGIFIYDILSCGLINAYGDNYYIHPGKDIEKEYLERGYSKEESYSLSLEDIGIEKFYELIKSECMAWNEDLHYDENSKITTLMTCYGDGSTYRMTVVGVLRGELKSIS